jgi:hypothetical protein
MACPWTGTGSDLRLVLLIQGVAQPVQRLNRPLLTYVPGQVCGADLAWGWAGDTERGNGRERVAAQVSEVPLDQVHLADVREWQIPVQPARHPEPGLVEARDTAGR